MTELPANKELLNEDWSAVLVGFLIIIVSLSLIVIPVPSYSWKSIGDLGVKISDGGNLLAIAGQFLVIVLGGAIAAKLSGKNAFGFLKMMPIVFLCTVVALFIAGNGTVKAYNLEPVIFSLVIGLVIGNTVNIPQWFRSALSTELLVKVGLVLLGTSVLFEEVLRAGGFGLIQALVVVISVWYFAYWICRRFKLDEELSMMLSSAVSICGVSAAIATAGAIKGDPKKLSYVISLVLITAIPMMIVMPWLANYFGWPERVTGAWLGGTIDTTGAVIASGSLVGEVALQTSTIVKFSQNVLLGLAAFAISVYWTIGKKGATATTAKPTLATIWERFPKFVLGFIAASILFSFFISPEKIGTVKDSLKSIQTLWFVLAFTSIGLETRFADLAGANGSKPLWAFLIAQLFNILITAVMAWWLFS
jgi:uncharacterized integral membrane protein (TIGR00698 family)